MRAWVFAAAATVAVTAARPGWAQTRRPAPPPAPAPPQPAGPKPLSQTLTGEAKAAYDAAKLLVGDGDFAGAAIKFRAAYDQSGDARLLWNIAACEKSQRHYARTIALVRQYLDTGKDLLTDADRREARALLDAIESFTVRLTIVVKEPGADVYVDDEKVGTTPLEGPVTVDIGQRRITVKKAGFRDATQQLPVGGSTTARVELALEPDVHEGRLTVTAPPEARIAIDGKVVATGHFEGKLHSGGHTLRVEADGMRTYQSEVVLADDENRSVDVPLEKIYVPPPPPPAGAVFEIGLSDAAGIKLHGDHPWMNTARLDVSYHQSAILNLRLFAQVGTIEASGSCGTDAHGPYPSQPLDLSVRNSFQSCDVGEAGLELVVHFLPAHVVDPWISVEPAGRVTRYEFSSYDPLDEVTRPTTALLPAFDVGGRVGIDFHPVASFHPWAIGALGSVVYTVIANENPATNAGNDANGAPNVHDSGVSPVHYFSVLFGLRSSLAF